MNIGKNGFFGISNTFTIFRPLTEDFGEAGAMVFVFLLGVIGNMAIKAVTMHRRVVFFQVVLVALYAFLMWSFSASFYAYTTFLTMFALVFVILYAIQKEIPAC
jgi:oligosaccharide repeat unit polymerase